MASPSKSPWPPRRICASYSPLLSLEVVYDLVVTLDSALMKFSIEMDGAEMGMVKANFKR